MQYKIKKQNKLFFYVCIFFQRLPDNFEILRQIDRFSVEKVLAAKKGIVDSIIENFCSNGNIKEKIIDQYNSINLIKWVNIADTTKFWTEVLEYKDSAGNDRFKEISNFAIQLLSLPWSNADVERLFSQMNLVKTKLRNRIQSNTVNAILHVRYVFLKKIY